MSCSTDAALAASGVGYACEIVQGGPPLELAKQRQGDGVIRASGRRSALSPAGFAFGSTGPGHGSAFSVPRSVKRREALGRDPPGHCGPSSPANRHHEIGFGPRRCAAPVDGLGIDGIDLKPCVLEGCNEQPVFGFDDACDLPRRSRSANALQQLHQCLQARRTQVHAAACAPLARHHR